MTQDLYLSPAPTAEQQRTRRKMGNAILLGLGSMAIGAALGYGVIGMNRTLFKSLHPAELLWLLPAIWAAIAWHELGHLIGARIGGFRLALFAAGPLLVKRVGKRLRLQYNDVPMYWGGVAASLPGPDYPYDTERLRRDMLRTVLFGPLFSLLGGLALPLGSPGLFFGMISLCIALATLIPQRTGGFASDGLRVLQLARKGPPAYRWASLAGLMGMSIALRPREWPEEWVQTGSMPREESLDGISGAWVRSSWHLDREEFPEAEAWLAFAVRNAERWPAPMRSTLYVSAAFLLAWAKGDVAAARDYMKLAGPKALLDCGGKFAEAACLLAEGSREAAEAQLKGVIPTPANQHLLTEMLQKARA